MHGFITFVYAILSIFVGHHAFDVEQTKTIFENQVDGNIRIFIWNLL
jgi:hypothetical protein